jgi:two-component system, OmpR family, heavy metal sensor histidine kinase CusS
VLIRRKLASPLSISAKSWLLTIASTFLLLVVGVFVQYQISVQLLDEDDALFLADEVLDLKRSLWKHGEDSQFIRQELEDSSGPYTREHELFYSRILDETGRVLRETRDMSRLIPPSEFPPAVDPSDGLVAPRQFSWQSPLGRSYLLASGAAPVGHGTVRLVQVALDRTDDLARLATYRHTVLAGVLGGGLIAALLAAGVVHFSMKPVSEFEKVATGISTGNLSKRIGLQPWPDELRALAKAIDGMLDRLEDGFVRLGRVAAEAAHEIRSPIQVLMVQTETALSRERSADEYRQVLESNLEEFSGLSRMINGLLLLARAQGAEAPIERVWLDVRQELEAVREFHEAMAEDLGVSVRCEGEGKLLADRMLLRRAVSNLLSNALRHTSRGGRIALSVEPSQGDRLVVKVSDTGSGIPPEKLATIWDRRHLTKSISELGSQGAGLGLPIVKTIANLHGGTAAVESTSIEGTVVALDFPAANQAPG